MKNNFYVRKIPNIFVVILTLILSLSFLMPTAVSVFAWSDDSIEIINNENLEIGQIPGASPDWIASRIISEASEEYAFISNNANPPFYDRGGMIIGAAVNEEIYGLFGTDKVNEHRLVPIHDLNAFPIMGSDGMVALKIRTVSSLPSPCVITNDTRKLKDCDAPIKINDNTTVGTGKILYRVSASSFGNWGAWSFENISDYLNNSNKSLIFPVNLYVQIVVIYEIQDPAPSIFQPHKYFHVRGVYCFYTFPI